VNSDCQGFGLPGGFSGGGIADTDTGSNFATRYESLPGQGYYGSHSVLRRTTQTNTYETTVILYI
jgi:hypothetical protein